MAVTDALLALMVLAVGTTLAWRTRLVARVLLFASAMLVSALLFLPGEQLAALMGAYSIASSRQLAARTPWDVAEWTHFAIFVWLGMLVWIARPDLRGWKAWALVAVLSVAAEIAQGLAPGREPRVDDVILNLAGGVMGALAGIGIIGLLQWVRPRPDAKL